MYLSLQDAPVSERVRAILLTNDNRILFIKRIKPNKPDPYWVAPGGGVEGEDDTLLDALERELYEELGATCEVLDVGFELRHQKADKNLYEVFYICRLVDYDLTQRHGPEFDDPARGKYIPDAIELCYESIRALNIKTPELQRWLLKNLYKLREFTRDYV
ncbi:MAG: NUDIX hydrolase [Chloroflexota bacterium]